MRPLNPEPRGFWLPIIIAAVSLLLVPDARPPGAAEIITGDAVVIDGDTLEIDGRRLGLFNIDAPEPGQSCQNPDGSTYPCGTVATQYLMLLIGGRPVTCMLYDKDRTTGLLGMCSAGEDDLNKTMVLKGWALVRPQWKYHADYLGIEAQARKQRRGVWRGAFVKPWRWSPGEP